MIRSLLKWCPPTDTEAAATLKIQGHGQVWSKETEQKIRSSRRVAAASSKGLYNLGDLWDWENEQWLTKEGLIAAYDVPKLAAELLVTAIETG